MKIKPQPFLVVLLFFALASNSCRNHSEAARFNVTFHESSDFSITTLTDGIMIYQTIDNPTDFYSFDLETSKKVHLGSVSDYILNGYSFVKDEGKLYTYIAVAEKDSSLKNVLFEIDYTGNTVLPCISNQDSAPMIYLYKSPNGILQLKTPTIESGKTTHFELYEPQTGDCHDVITASDSELFVIAATQSNSLFVLVAQEVSNEQYAYYMNEYDLRTFHFIRTVDLSAIESYITKARIGKMEVFGDYFYFKNYSDDGIIFKISDNGISSVLLEKAYLDCAWNQENAIHRSEVLFFVQGTNECLLLNLDGGDLQHFESSLDRGYGISSIYADLDKVLVYARKPSNNKLFSEKVLLYYYDYSAFTNSKAVP